MHNRRRAAAKKGDVVRKQPISPVAARRIGWFKGGMSISDIARRDGVRRQAVDQMLARHGIVEGRETHVVNQQIAIISPMYERGLTRAEIHRNLPEDMELTLSQVGARIGRLPEDVKRRGRRVREKMRDDEYRARVKFLKDYGIRVPGGDNLRRIPVLERRIRNWERRAEAKVKSRIKLVSFAPLKLSRRKVNQKLTALNRRGVDWYSTERHQRLVDVSLERLLANWREVRGIGLHSKLHYLLSYDFVRPANNLRKQNDIGLRKAVSGKNHEALRSYAEGCAMRAAKKLMGVEWIKPESQLGEEIIQQAEVTLLETLDKISNPKANPEAAALILAITVAERAREIVKNFWNVRSGIRELEVDGTPWAKRELRRQMKRAA